MIYPRAAEVEYVGIWAQVADMLSFGVPALVLSEHSEEERESAIIAAIAVLLSANASRASAPLERAAESIARQVDAQVQRDARREAAADGVELPPRSTTPAATSRQAPSRRQPPAPRRALPAPAPSAPSAPTSSAPSPRIPTPSGSRARSPVQSRGVPDPSPQPRARVPVPPSAPPASSPTPPRGPSASDLIDEWVEQNVDLITNLDDQTRKWFDRAVREAFDKGWSSDQLANEIERVLGMSQRRSQLIARDQIGKLHGALTKHEAERVGVEEYVWTDSDDQRVRPKHRRFDGQRRKFSESPIPGEEIQCRCTARPVWSSAKLGRPLGASALELPGVTTR